MQVTGIAVALEGEVIRANDFVAKSKGDERRHTSPEVPGPEISIRPKARPEIAPGLVEACPHDLCANLFGIALVSTVSEGSTEQPGGNDAKAGRNRFYRKIKGEAQSRR